MVGLVEVGFVTATSFLSGGALGYVGGAAMGLPTLFRDSTPPSALGAGMKSARPPGLRSFLGQARRRTGSLNSKALATGRNWGELSAAFSGFHALTKVVRGNKEDRWNGVISSACAGAYMSRKGEEGRMMFLQTP